MKAVFILPVFPAAITTPLLEAIILTASTTISLNIIATGIIGLITPFTANIIKTEFTNTLSAIASANLPKSVTIFLFLAIYPSKKSVIEASINN